VRIQRKQSIKKSPPTYPSPSRGEGKGGGGSLYHRQQVLNSEKGIALVMVLILAAIALMIMAGLIFMVTSSTQISGMQKRYKTALEAGKDAAEIIYQFIGLRGDPTDTESFKNLLSSSINPVINTQAGCSGYDLAGASYTGLATKLNTPTYIESPPGSGILVPNWTVDCYSSMSIDKLTYDLKYEFSSLGNPTYTVYAKIVDTVEGNSAPDKGLGGKGVVVSGSGEVTVASMPYLYTVEVDAQNAANPLERSKLSILYQY